jgi:hypothetical protein
VMGIVDFLRIDWDYVWELKGLECLMKIDFKTLIDGRSLEKIMNISNDCWNFWSENLKLSCPRTIMISK